MVSKPVTPPRLVIIEGKDKGKVIPLKTGTVIIGRSKGDVLIQDPRISRSHVAIHFDEKTGKLTFTDLKSLNGTQINGDTVAKGRLRDGDKLQLGNTTFDCQMLDDDENVDKTELAEPRLLQNSKNADNRKTVLKTEPESGLSPMWEGTNAHLPEIQHWEGSDDEVSEVTNAPAEPPPRSRKPSLPAFNLNLRKYYLQIPARFRNVALIGLVLLTYLVYVGKNAANDPARMESDISEAKKLWSEKKLDEAVETAKRLLESYPEHSAPQMLLADMYASRENYEQAIQHYRKATELKPLQPTAHSRLLRLYLRTGLSEDAEKELQVVDAMLKKEGPPHKQFFIETAQIFVEFKELKQPPEKIFLLAKALQNVVAPESPIGYRLEAQVLFGQNRVSEALTTLVAGNKINPQDEWILENIAFARLSMEDPNGAMQAVDEWLRLRPNATKALLVMAYLKFNNKNALGALPYIQKIVQVASTNPQEPHYAEALNLAGQIYVQQNQNSEAEGFLKRSCELGFTRSCSHPLLQGKTPASVPDAKQ